MSVAETVGRGTRGKYYDEAGALRDSLQNHVLQVLTLVAMEAPSAWETDAIHGEKVKLLKSIRPIDPADVDKYSVRAQYTDGSIEGEALQGYLKTEKVAPDSTTETYAALKLLIDNKRWNGVPFYLRTGKAMTKRVTEVAIEFSPEPHPLFGEVAPNRLVLRIQPDEGITIRFNAKLPGQAINVREVNMDFRYGTSFGVPPSDAYERLLLDAMLGDSKLFARDDEVEVAWALMTRFLHGWAKQKVSRLPTPTR